jgi:hypothetical protein
MFFIVIFIYSQCYVYVFLLLCVFCSVYSVFIVLFYVLFVCKYLMYYCYLVPTQLHLTNISSFRHSGEGRHASSIDIWNYCGDTAKYTHI